MTESEAEKIARTEALFREVNERIAESAERFDATATNFVCECADPACTHRVGATLEQYERVREEGDTFLLVPGHEDERIEKVVRLVDEKAAVVEKREPAVRRLVLELDPRAGEAA
jgi:transcription initiation factor TFIID subunit TAF12